jgi:hypothetical protein
VTPTIAVTIPGHGTFTTWANTLDAILSSCMALSLADIHAMVRQSTGLDLSDVHDKTALFVVIANHEGF